MNAGLPGTGLGGLFYIVGALWMPVGAAYGRLRGRRGIPWRVVLRQSGIAAGVLVALWLTGWTVGYLVALGAPAPAGAGGDAGAQRAVTSVVRWATVLGTGGVLAAVVAGVQVLRLVVPRPRRREAAPGGARVGAIGLALPVDPAPGRPVREVA